MFESCPRNIESKFSETCFLLFDELPYVFCITVIIVSKKRSTRTRTPFSNI